MSDEEDTAILLNSANKTIETSINKISNDYQCLPPKNLRKPLPKQNDNLTPLTSGNKSIFVSMVAILAGIAFGSDMGIAKPIAPLIKHEFNLNCFEKDFVISIWFVGALVGGLTGGFLIDSFGRRWTMISTLVFLTFGATLSALANHYILLLVARIICGYSGSVSAVAHCIYMAEVSEPNKRGYNIMLYQLGTATGFLISVIAAAIKNIDYQWRFSIGITAVPALAACIITIIFLQRSPPFLLYKRMANVSKTSSKKAWYAIFETLTIMALLLVLQQEVTALISLGIVKVFSTMLSLVIVEKCGRRTALITSATICMTTISLLSLLATIDRGDDNLDIANNHCKNYHNDEMKIHTVLPTGSPPPFPLLPTPLAITAPSPETWTQIKASCETQNIAVSEGLTGGLRILAVITLLVYEAAYALGLGSVPLLNFTEVFPAAVRGKCVSFVSIVIWITHIIATESVSAMTKSLTLAGSYLFYSFMCLVTIFYVFLFIPETKGKSLHQIAQELRKISLGTRICNNLRSLPLICHSQWIKKYDGNVSNGQSTLI
ncbi:PREDICTED: solute carrier family 2, facilitated glucose transporter member 10-like isoform X2 [Eufriesea mexicana]|uniref:solute carrier family 2, facilitated glucose transporter member 10-like isoform X2 n=1 Tax=Eufriesea mexicana TaxID=516756 RepID=UPI00083BFD3A|nr:PREDICTED: solute carrier family 2, facilitated glucose transporter member 10-like isoform X2 [Eufriesea mexicana]